MRSNVKLFLLAAALVAAAGAGPLAAGAEAQVIITRESDTPRGWLGIARESSVIVQSGGAITQEVRIVEVVKDSPAEAAGLRAGDEVLRINGAEASDALFATLGATLKPGDKVNFRVRRDGRELDVSVTAAPWPAGRMAGAWLPGQTLRIDPDSILGLTRLWLDSARVAIEMIPGMNFERWADDSARVRIFRRGEMPLQLDSIAAGMRMRFGQDSLMRVEMDQIRERMRRFEVDAVRGDSILRRVLPLRDSLTYFFESGPARSFSIVDRAMLGAEMTDLDPAMESYFGTGRGVLVLRVPEGTPAARAGLRPGDIVVEAGGSAIASVAELRRAVAALPSGQAVRLEVRRERRPLTLEFRR
jgi:C-terminal processing protease CtpA/Prc